LALMALGQDQTPSPAASSPTASLAPAATASATAKDDLESRIEGKMKKKGLSITIGDHDKDGDHDRVRVHKNSDGEDIGALMAIPIVGIIFTTLFGAPVLVVAAIMFFSYLRSRSLHRTVRMMVEKGQPVPAALFAPPPVVRARSDMRRGVVLVMVGLGCMVFFGAVNDWEGGAWALGIIPFLIGAGYLLVWKLEGGKANGVKASTDNPPPLP
ncbi:MAG: DUF6249 domain-containing protein, partial [Chthoniobacterales bacterium]